MKKKIVKNSNISIDFKSKKEIKQHNNKKKHNYFFVFSIISIILISCITLSLLSNNYFFLLLSLVIIVIGLPIFFYQYKQINYKYIPKKYINDYFSQMSTNNYKNKENNNLNFFRDKNETIGKNSYYHLYLKNEKINENDMYVVNDFTKKSFSLMTRKDFFFFINFSNISISLEHIDFDILYKFVCENNNYFSLNPYVKFFDYTKKYMQSLFQLEDKVNSTFEDKQKEIDIFKFKVWIEEDYFYKNEDFLFVSLFVAFCGKINNLNEFRKEYWYPYVLNEMDMVKTTISFLMKKYDLSLYESVYFLSRISNYNIPYWSLIYSYIY